MLDLTGSFDDKEISTNCWILCILPSWHKFLIKDLHHQLFRARQLGDTYMKWLLPLLLYQQAHITATRVTEYVVYMCNVWPIPNPLKKITFFEGSAQNKLSNDGFCKKFGLQMSGPANGVPSSRKDLCFGFTRFRNQNYEVCMENVFDFER